MKKYLSIYSFGLYAFCLLLMLGHTPTEKTNVIFLSGDLSEVVEDIIDELPGKYKNNYLEPNASQLDKWEQMLSNLLADNQNEASTLLSPLGYDLIEFTDNPSGKKYYLIKKKSSSTNHWGVYIFNPLPARGNLIIQSPHVKYDSFTGQEGLHVFMETEAAWFMMNGTHRCNQDDMSECDGSTKVCSKSEPKTSESYRISDMAHSGSSIFQKTTEFLNDNLVAPYFIQFHGFGHSAGDPYLILSNGKGKASSPDPFPAFRTEILNRTSTLSTNGVCIVHEDFDNLPKESKCYKLKAFSNTQGRYINGSKQNPCDDPSSSPSGRFFHIEQEKELFRRNVSGWNIMAGALAAVFDCSVNNGTYQNCNSMFSHECISSGQTVTFKAGSSLTFKPGFKAKSGSVFKAKVESCQ